MKMLIFSYPSVLTYVLGAQKNHLIETVLLSTHNICFGCEIRKLNFHYALLTKDLCMVHTLHLRSTVMIYSFEDLYKMSVTLCQNPYINMSS